QGARGEGRARRHIARGLGVRGQAGSRRRGQARGRRRDARDLPAAVGRTRQGPAPARSVLHARKVIGDAPPWAAEFLAVARVGRLATADASGRPLVVPICYALDGGLIYSAVDAKPKRTRELRRLRNIAENPLVSLVVDEYDEDWTRLRYVIVEGHADVLTGGDEVTRAVDALVTK